VYIEKKTQRLPAITLAGALVNIGTNFLLIPTMGMMGGALATLLAYAVMALALYVDVRRFYPVRYEWGRIAHVSLVAGGVYFLFRVVGAGSYHLLWKLFLLVAFCIVLYVSRFFLPDELQAIRRLIHRRPPPEA
jgi:O-antigen/teichoic acid export membrane protein